MLFLLSTIVLTALDEVHAKMDLIRPIERALHSSVSSTSSSFDGYDMVAKFESSDCSGTPVLLIAKPGCGSLVYEPECNLADFFDANASLLDKVPYSHAQDTCATEVKTFADDAFGDQVYLRLDYYRYSDCTEFGISNIFVADGECHSMITYADYSLEAIAMSFRVTVNSNATITYEFYDDRAGCTGEPETQILVTNEMVSNKICDFYTVANTNLYKSNNGQGVSESSSSDGESTSVSESKGEGGLSTGAVVGVVVGCFALVVIVVSILLWRRKARSDNVQDRMVS